MKQLYIRKGNLETNQNILIIGEETTLGGRDSAYRTKGTINKDCLGKDPYTKATGLSYVHACKNILLNSKYYKSDHDVHYFIKNHCKDLVIWDGESNEGITNSREAFIVVKNKNVEDVVKELYNRINNQINPNGLLQKAISQTKLKRFNRQKKNINVKKDVFELLIWLLVLFVVYKLGTSITELYNTISIHIKNIF